MPPAVDSQQDQVDALPPSPFCYGLIHVLTCRLSAYARLKAGFLGLPTLLFTGFGLELSTVSMSCTHLLGLLTDSIVSKSDVSPGSAGWVRYLSVSALLTISKAESSGWVVSALLDVPAETRFLGQVFVFCSFLVSVTCRTLPVILSTGSGSSAGTDSSFVRIERLSSSCAGNGGTGSRALRFASMITNN